MTDENERYWLVRSELESFDTKLIGTLVVVSSSKADLEAYRALLAGADFDIKESRTRTYGANAQWIMTLWSASYVRADPFEDWAASEAQTVLEILYGLAPLPQSVHGILSFHTFYGERFGWLTIPSALVRELGQLGFDIRTSGELSA